MDRAADYLRRIHDTVRSTAGDGPDPGDMMEFTKKIAAALGLPPQAVNPLLARTLAANLRVRERARLGEE